MKERLQKLKDRRFKIDNNTKICRRCGNEYNEKENFNWSCRTHLYPWGGEMYWCCGKQEYSHPGCKYQKHENKDDEDDEEVAVKEKAAHRIRCMCCKEHGHPTEECPRDPNIKTG